MPVTINGSGRIVVQVLNTTLTTVLSTTSGSYVDATGLSVNITPTSSSNRILVFANVSLMPANSAGGIWQLVRNSTAIAVGTEAGYSSPATGGFYTQSGASAGDAWCGNATSFLDNPATTSTVTYKIQYRSLNGGTTTFINRRSNAADINFSSSITVMEISG